jgi:ribosomal protein S18 acetylase RimI-like enzyme
VIRPARADDAVAIAALDAATWSFDVTPSPRSSVPSSIDGMLVAEDGGEIVGYVAVGRATRLESNRHVADIRGLAVAPDHQGRGLGRALVQAALDAARERGARKVTLRVLGPNTAARALYESCGFVVEGVRRDEFLLDGRYVDDVLMARHLSG